MSLKNWIKQRTVEIDHHVIRPSDLGEKDEVRGTLAHLCRSRFTASVRKRHASGGWNFKLEVCTYVFVPCTYLYLISCASTTCVFYSCQLSNPSSLFKVEEI